MTFLLLSFFAGVLTVLAPCVLPLLPVIIGGSFSGKTKRNPFVITVSLAVSVIAFTLILKWSSLFVHIPPETWAIISGSIIIFFGLISLFPNLWEKISGNLTGLVSRKSNQVLATGYKKQGITGDILMGAALGPVFSSCSPTYFVILASVLPQSFSKGLIDLIAYSIGLSLMLFLISFFGQKLVGKLAWATDPEGWFKRSLGVLFILVGVFIIGGFDKKVQAYILNNIFDITKLEISLLQKTEPTQVPIKESVATTTQEKIIITTPETKKTKSVLSIAQNPKRDLPRYHEIVDAAGYVNSDPFTIGQFVGKKVILLDVMTYSCINCQRTFPYVVAWWNKYKDQGLEVIGIHTPEFAFEKVKENVQAGLAKFGITFPVELDNNYATWNAYGNNFWPRKYLIDIYGNIVYDHIGEGGYSEIEKKIQEALAERSAVLGLNQEITKGTAVIEVAVPHPDSPETYFGAARNQFLGNGMPGQTGLQNFTEPSLSAPNTFYFSGSWNVQKEFAESASAGAKIIFKYNGQDVYFVASDSLGVSVKVLRDGVAVSAESGTDVSNGSVLIKESRLYHLIHEKEKGTHTLQLIIEQSGLEAYTFTFG